MAKRDNGTKRTNGRTTTTDASGATTADAMEQRVVAFAEQLGRMAGTVQAKAEGWLDRETLNQQIASVRDGAADLLEQLAGGATKASKKKPARRGGARRSKGRSGGVVDAPGKKHRKPMPTDPGANDCGQSGGKNADGKDDGEDEPAPRARLAGLSTLIKARSARTPRTSGLDIFAGRAPLRSDRR